MLTMTFKKSGILEDWSDGWIDGWNCPAPATMSGADVRRVPPTPTHFANPLRQGYEGQAATKVRRGPSLQAVGPMPHRAGGGTVRMSGADVRRVGDPAYKL